MKVRFCYVKNVFYVPFLYQHAHCLQHCDAVTQIVPTNSVVTVDVQLSDSQWELTQICAKIRTTFAEIIQTSVANSDDLTSDVMFSRKFLMSDVLATNLMLSGLLFLFSTIPLLFG